METENLTRDMVAALGYQHDRSGQTLDAIETLNLPTYHAQGSVISHGAYAGGQEATGCINEGGTRDDSANMSASDVLMSSFNVLEDGDPMHSFHLGAQPDPATAPQATRDQYSPILSDYNVVWSEPASTSALLAALCAPCRTSTSPLNPSEGSRWKEGQERPAVNVSSTNEHIPDVYSETAEGLTSTYWTFPQQDQVEISLPSTNSDEAQSPVVSLSDTSLNSGNRGSDSTAISSQTLVDMYGLSVPSEKKQRRSPKKTKDGSSDIGLPFSCNQCYKRYALPTDLDKHLKTEHDGSVVYTCFTCGKKFSHSDLLREHVSTHANDPITCTLCNMKLASSRELRAHHKNAHPIPILVCNICSKNFPTRTARSAHMRTVHRDDVRVLLCKVCGDPFTDRHSLREHLKNHVCDNMLMSPSPMTSSPGNTTRDACTTSVRGDPPLNSDMILEHIDQKRNNQIARDLNQFDEKGNLCQVDLNHHENRQDQPNVPQYELLRLLLTNDTKREVLQRKRRSSSTLSSSDKSEILSAETVQHVADELHILESMSEEHKGKPLFPHSIVEGDTVVGVGISFDGDRGRTLRVLEKQRTLVNRLQGTVASIIEKEIKHPSFFEESKSRASGTPPVSDDGAKDNSKYSNDEALRGSRNTTRHKEGTMNQSALAILLQMPVSARVGAPPREAYTGRTNSFVFEKQDESGEKIRQTTLMSSATGPLSQASTVHEFDMKQDTIGETLLSEFRHTLAYPFVLDLGLEEKESVTALGLHRKQVQICETSGYSGNDLHGANWVSQPGMDPTPQTLLPNDIQTPNLSTQTMLPAASTNTSQVHLTQLVNRSEEPGIGQQKMSNLSIKPTDPFVHGNENTSRISGLLLENQKPDDIPHSDLVSQLPLTNHQLTGQCLPRGPSQMVCPETTALSNSPFEAVLVGEGLHMHKAVQNDTSLNMHKVMCSDRLNEAQENLLRDSNYRVSNFMGGCSQYDLTSNNSYSADLLNTNQEPTELQSGDYLILKDHGRNSVFHNSSAVPTQPVRPREVATTGEEGILSSTSMTQELSPTQMLLQDTCVTAAPEEHSNTASRWNNAHPATVGNEEHPAITYGNTFVEPGSESTQCNPIEGGHTSLATQEEVQRPDMNPPTRTSWDHHIESLWKIFESSVPNLSEKIGEGIFDRYHVGRPASDQRAGSLQPIPLGSTDSNSMSGESGGLFRTEMSTNGSSRSETLMIHREVRACEEILPGFEAHAGRDMLISRAIPGISGTCDENSNLKHIEPAVYAGKSQDNTPTTETSGSTVLKDMLSSGCLRQVTGPLVVRHKLLADMLQSTDHGDLKADSLIGIHEYKLDGSTSSMSGVVEPLKDDGPALHGFPHAKDDVDHGRSLQNCPSNQSIEGVCASTIDHRMLSEMMYSSEAGQTCTSVATERPSTNPQECLIREPLDAQSSSCTLTIPPVARKRRKTYRKRNMKVVLQRIDAVYHIVNGRVWMDPAAGDCIISTDNAQLKGGYCQGMSERKEPQTVANGNRSEAKRAYYKKGSYQCDICNKVYAWKNYLRKHLAKHMVT